MVFGCPVRGHARGPQAAKSRNVDFPMVFHVFGGLVRAHGRGPEASKSSSVDFQWFFIVLWWPSKIKGGALKPQSATLRSKMKGPR